MDIKSSNMSRVGVVLQTAKRVGCKLKNVFMEQIALFLSISSIFSIITKLIFSMHTTVLTIPNKLYLMSKLNATTFLKTSTLDLQYVVKF